MTFEEFFAIIRDAEKQGIVRTDEPLTDFDLAVIWATDQVAQKKGGYPCDVSLGEIYSELPDQFKEDTNGDH